MITDFTLDGQLPPLQVTPSDHEGGGFVQILQVNGDKLLKQTVVPRLSGPGPQLGQRGVVVEHVPTSSPAPQHRERVNGLRIAARTRLPP
jgi:hypothetical protein